MSDTKKVGRRGRPLSFDPEAAVGTALGLFHARGYDGVGVAELVDKLGIKPPSFYAAFGSKAGLFERCLERYATTDSTLLPAALAGGGGAADVLGRIFRNAAAIYPKQDGIAGCMVLDTARGSNDADARALAARGVSEFREALVAIISAEAEPIAGQLADFTLATLTGMSAAARDGMTGERLARMAAIAARSVEREIAEQ